MNKNPAVDNPGFFVYQGILRYQVNIHWIVRSILSSYWGSHRSRRQIVESIYNSTCFGVYRCSDHTLVGFARVVTDKATFSWICDVIVDPDFRGRGLGSMLMRFIAIHLEGTVQVLGTRDAHAFYEKAGFKRCEQMKKIPGQ